MMIVLCLCLVGCGNDQYSGAPLTDRMVIVEKQEFGSFGYSIQMYGRETKVMYLFIKSGYGGGLSIMLDADGNPLLYIGD